MNKSVGGIPHPEGRRAVYQQAASWSADVHDSLRASRRLAWTVAAVAGGIALLLALAIVLMLPLKTVVPYTLTVDRQTGFVEQTRGLDTGNLTQELAVTQASLVQYVIARETFDATDLRENYQKVMLWSGEEARKRYQRDMQRSTPSSPLNLYTAGTMLAVTVKSVSLLTPTTALVRFDTTRRDPGAGSGQQQSYTAVIAFRYTGAPLSMGDRFLNPLGFQVTRYRRDADTPAAATVPLNTNLGSAAR